MRKHISPATVADISLLEVSRENRKVKEGIIPTFDYPINEMTYGSDNVR